MPGRRMASGLGHTPPWPDLDGQGGAGRALERKDPGSPAPSPLFSRSRSNAPSRIPVVRVSPDKRPSMATVDELAQLRGLVVQLGERLELLQRRSASAPLTPTAERGRGDTQRPLSRLGFRCHPAVTRWSGIPHVVSRSDTNGSPRQRHSGVAHDVSLQRSQSSCTETTILSTDALDIAAASPQSSAESRLSDVPGQHQREASFTTTTTTSMRVSVTSNHAIQMPRQRYGTSDLALVDIGPVPRPPQIHVRRPPLTQGGSNDAHLPVPEGYPDETDGSSTRGHQRYQSVHGRFCDPTTQSFSSFSEVNSSRRMSGGSTDLRPSPQSFVFPSSQDSAGPSPISGAADTLPGRAVSPFEVSQEGTHDHDNNAFQNFSRPHQHSRTTVRCVSHTRSASGSSLPTLVELSEHRSSPPQQHGSGRDDLRETIASWSTQPEQDDSRPSQTRRLPHSLVPLSQQQSPRKGSWKTLFRRIVPKKSLRIWRLSKANAEPTYGKQLDPDHEPDANTACDLPHEPSITSLIDTPQEPSRESQQHSTIPVASRVVSTASDDASRQSLMHIFEDLSNTHKLPPAIDHGIKQVSPKRRSRADMSSRSPTKRRMWRNHSRHRNGSFAMSMFSFGSGPSLSFDDFSLLPPTFPPRSHGHILD